MKNTYKKIKKNQYRIYITIPVIFLICLLFFMNLFKLKEYKDSIEKTEVLEEQIRLKNEENSGLKSILEIDDDEFYKMIAREKYGYASPDERIYYDIGY